MLHVAAAFATAAVGCRHTPPTPATAPAPRAAVATAWTTEPLTHDWPLQIGMTMAEAAAALHIPMNVPGPYTGGLSSGSTYTLSPLYPDKALHLFWRCYHDEFHLTAWYSEGR